MTDLNGVQRQGYTSYPTPSHKEEKGNSVLAGATGLTVAAATGGAGHIAFGVEEGTLGDGSKIYQQFDRAYIQSTNNTKDYQISRVPSTVLDKANLNTVSKNNIGISELPKGLQFYHIQDGKLINFTEILKDQTVFTENFDKTGKLELGKLESKHYSTGTANGYKDNGKEINGYLHHVYKNGSIIESPNFGTDISEPLIRKEVWDKNPEMQQEFQAFKPKVKTKMVDGKEQQFIALNRFSKTADDRLNQFGGLPKGTPKTFDEVLPYLKQLQTNRTLQFLGAGAVLAIPTYFAVEALTKKKKD
jgi:hypothetical protein